MANDETNSGPTQEQLPDLYRLLGLSPLEPEISKIQRALQEMQRKVEVAQKTDAKLAQRAAKVVALGKKNLLEPDRKSTYDRAWSKTFGSSDSKATELEWELDELESYLPAEDPRGAFDLGGFLRYSANMPESNPIADYDKLQSFLGGTATATIAAPESIAATSLMPEYDQQRHVSSEEAEPYEQVVAPRLANLPPRVPPGGFAKQIRRKRTRAMLMSVGGIVGAIALVSGAAIFWAMNNKSPAKPTDQLAQATKPNTKPDKTKVDAPDDLVAPTIPPTAQGSGLPKVAGLGGEDEVPKVPENSASMQPAPMPVDPPPSTTPPATAVIATAVPATTPPTTPTPTTTEPAPTPPTTMAPTPPTPEPTPEPTPVPAADPVLTDGEKSKWSKRMKELLKTLGNQDFVAAKKQLKEAEELARTQLQKDQFKRLATVARLTEEYKGFLVDAISGLGPAETFKIGSVEAAFVEGNEQGVSLKIRGRLQSSKLTDLQIGIANGLVDLKMDRAHPSSLARKAAFALVHPKTNDAALKAARDQMAEAAGAGAVEVDMATVFDEDYSLKK